MPLLLLFDVDETLLDLSSLAPVFARRFPDGEGRA
jgi:FMN phosphatase YigB (HAD superfamily)